MRLRDLLCTMTRRLIACEFPILGSHGTSSYVRTYIRVYIYVFRPVLDYVHNIITPSTRPCPIRRTDSIRQSQTVRCEILTRFLRCIRFDSSRCHASYPRCQQHATRPKCSLNLHTEQWHERIQRYSNLTRPMRARRKEVSGR